MPAGVPKSGHDYQNVYQCGYFPIEMDFENKKYKLGEFHELDKGFDIYATQTFLDENGRRILIGGWEFLMRIMTMMQQWNMIGSMH